MDKIGFFVPAWRKSTFSESGSCVEVANRDDGAVIVRDTKSTGEARILTFQPSVWNGFIREMRRSHHLSK